MFLDLLGFKNIVNSSVNNEDDFNKINIALDLFLKFQQNNDAQVTCFSDSIVISFEATQRSELFHTLLKIQYLIFEVLNAAKLFVRGAVAIGELIHTNDKVFGNGLVKAYELESKFANFPRIIVDNEVIEFCTHHGQHAKKQERQYIEQLLQKDIDGFYFIDYLISIRTEFDSEFDYPSYLLELRGLIIKGLDNANTGVKIKYEWLKSHFNHIVSEIQRNNILEDNELRDIYNSIGYIS